ncbi:hypothetical protein [Kitasatospora sp. NPDC097691]|uniref:hypothetical protein n=1 Tax=Kitasatospora sp. NPDC097691 TaxID=3157231 RepID=UPI0033263CD0
MTAPTPPPPRRPPAAGSPWATSPRSSTERTTNRLRRLVEGLPDWEPLPPGEITVRRPGTGL